jgi:hypothetical protein
MLKNIIITILSIIVVLFWLGADTDSVDEFDDPDAVAIEYKCSTLDEYKYVPPEVINECILKRRLLTRNTI